MTVDKQENLRHKVSWGNALGVAVVVVIGTLAETASAASANSPKSTTHFFEGEEPFGTLELKRSVTVTVIGIPIMTLKASGSYDSALKRARGVSERLNDAFSRLSQRENSETVIKSYLVVRGYSDFPLIFLNTDETHDPVLIVKVHEKDALRYSERSEIGVTVQLLSRYWVGVLSVLLGTEDADEQGRRVGSTALTELQTLHRYLLGFSEGEDGRISVPASLARKVRTLAGLVPSDVPKHGRIHERKEEG